MSINKVGLMINGTRDCWIAEALAEKEIDVMLYDQSGQNAASVLSQIEAILDWKLTKWAITQTEKKVILSHIKLVSDLEPLKEADYLIESAGDCLESKKTLLNQLDKICPKELIIASNTCIFQVSELAEGLENPQRLIGLHFLRDLVEIIPGEQTCESTLDHTSKFVEKIGKTGIRVSDDHGLVAMRLMLPLINEAVAILLEERATPEEIDQAMIKGFGFKYGPLEIVDRLGLDYVLHAMEQMFERTGDDKYRPSLLLTLHARTKHGKWISQNGQEDVQA